MRGEVRKGTDLILGKSHGGKELRNFDCDSECSK